MNYVNKGDLFLYKRGNCLSMETDHLEVVIRSFHLLSLEQLENCLKMLVAEGHLTTKTKLKFVEHENRYLIDGLEGQIEFVERHRQYSAFGFIIEYSEERGWRVKTKNGYLYEHEAPEKVKSTAPLDWDALEAA